MAGDASETSASGGVSEDLRTLEYTPTWVLATVSTVFVVISIAVERFLHFLGNVRFNSTLIYSSALYNS